MRCPNCGSKSIVRRVWLEDKDGIKDRHHVCTSCKAEFFSYQAVDRTRIYDMTRGEGCDAGSSEVCGTRE